MEKKCRSIAAILVIVLSVSLSACGDSSTENLGDEYNEGSDYQYMFDNRFNMGIDRTYGKNGYYFMQGHYIYFMDDETHTFVPLCNKADCMHNEETDSSRYADCNAYVEDGKFKETYKVMQCPLTGTNQEESIIYEQPDGIYLFNFSSMWAYGNHVYFTVQGNTTEDSDLYLGDEWWNYCYCQMFVYNTQDGTLGEITPPEAEGAEGCVPYFSSVTFWNGKILLSLSDAGVELGEQQKLYIADLDGSNMEVFLEDAAYGDYYYNDGTNLYIANYAQVTRGIEEEEIFRVYDSDMNLVDTFTVPWSGTWNVGIGKEEGTYFWAYGDDDLDEDGETIVSMSLYFFDKSSIGSLNGGASCALSWRRSSRSRRKGWCWRCCWPTASRSHSRAAGQNTISRAKRRITIPTLRKSAAG